MLLTCRLIKSFEYRSIFHLIIKDFDPIPQSIVSDLKEHILKAIAVHPTYSKLFSNVVLNTLKIYYQPHGTKSQNLAINLENDDTLLMLPDSRLISEFPLQDETEISFFNMAGYESFKSNPIYKFM